jgi:site-specific DNA recombinase
VALKACIRAVPPALVGQGLALDCRPDRRAGHCMGRLTLDVLLSFAQFEREVIGEWVRDKIAASKRKGIWVGGPVPLGYRCIDKKLVVAPEEAKAVRIIFSRYLTLGSIAALIEDLDRRGIRTKASGLADGRVRGGIRFGVGSLGHLLRNRFYIGEVVYRGGVNRGEHEPILDRELFAAVQAKLAANTVARQVRLKGSPAILAGRIFDDCGNRMSPTHSNKGGVRYRYYVSHAVVQQRKAEAGSVARVPAPEIENVVLDGVRKHLASVCEVEHATTLADRDLIDRYVDRVIVKPLALEVRLVLASQASAASAESGIDDSERRQVLTTTITLAWTVPSFVALKGIVHAPCAKPAMKPASRYALLTAIIKARGWIDDIRRGRIASFAEISQREGQVSGTSACWHHWPSSHRASLRPSPMAPHLRISRLPVSPRPCRTHGSSRSKGLGSKFSQDPRCRPSRLGK